MKKCIAVFVTAALSLAACDPADPSPQPSTTSPVAGATPSPTAAGRGDIGGPWILESGYSAQGVIGRKPGWEVTLDIGDGFLGGIAACNGYGGSLRTRGSDLKVRGLNQTLIGCGDEIEAIESRYMSALGEVDRFSLKGDILVLRGPDGELRFLRAESPPVADIGGVRWRLVEIVGFPDRDPFPADAPSTFTLDADGSLRAETGCGLLRGKWREVAHAIELSESHLRGGCKRGSPLTDQEQAIIGVLGRFTVDVEGDTMTLQRYPGDLKLVYGAS